MAGKLIVLEGIDGCGKTTQFKLLTDRLTAQGREYRRLRFPRYENPSSTLVRMYLGGKFGTDPECVNAYAASTFYAVDRYASYLEDWGEYYRAGGLVLTDRYTTSNAVHQAAKMAPGERADFFRWLFHFEYELLELPRPDRVLLLDMEPAAAAELRRRRCGAEDIHEADESYLAACRETALEAAAFDCWTVIEIGRAHV